MTTKAMTKEQAEKAAMEFAWGMINAGCKVGRMSGCDNVIRITYNEKFRPFHFINLVPGDACLVWNSIPSIKKMRVFNRIDQDGSTIFNDNLVSARVGSSGRRWDNYRKLGFNVLEIEKEKS